MSSKSSSPPPRAPVVFATTQWTRVLAAQGEAPEARQALSDLCAAYYDPVVAVLRGERHSDDEAREIAHSFFERILERHGLDGAEPSLGRFRSYLLGALRHFLANRRVHSGRQKRGGSVEHVSLEPELTESDPSESSPSVGAPDDAAFDRAWALCVLERAFEVLAQEASESGTTPEFQALKPWLIGDGPAEAGQPAPTQRSIAGTLGMNDGTFRVALHRFRRRFRSVVKAEIAATVSDPADVADELRHLIAALSIPTDRASAAD